MALFSGGVLGPEKVAPLVGGAGAGGSTVAEVDEEVGRALNGTPHPLLEEVAFAGGLLCLGSGSVTLHPRKSSSHLRNISRDSVIKR